MRYIELIEKFNPYHSTVNGQFTSGTSMGAFAPTEGKTANGQKLLSQYKEKQGATAKPEKTSSIRTDAEVQSMVDKIKKDNAELLSDRYADPALIRMAVYKELGYDAKPTVLKDREFNGADGEVVYRGIDIKVRTSSPDPNTQNREASRAGCQQFKSGELFPGEGIYGGGTYTSTGYYTANQYAGRNGAVLQMKVPKTAKLVDFDTIEDLYRVSKLTDYNSGYHSVIAEVGTYAALLGYDGIRVPGAIPSRGEDFIVLLNRGKAVVNEKIIDSY